MEFVPRSMHRKEENATRYAHDQLGTQEGKALINKVGEVKAKREFQRKYYEQRLFPSQPNPNLNRAKSAGTSSRNNYR